jgi:TolB-like protein
MAAPHTGPPESTPRGADDRLDSWKEIASYLKRDVSTVQRWEKNEHLPIRRHLHGKLGSVYAFTPEIDAWWEGRSVRLEPDARPLELSSDHRGNQDDARIDLRQLEPIQPSIAVLAFANMSGDADDEYFSDGLAGEIINALTRVSGLKVIARTSAFAFKGKNQDVRKIADALGVTSVLEGSVRRAGSRLRVNADLIHAADGTHLWSER